MIAFLEALIALDLPVGSCVLAVNWLGFGFLISFLGFFGTVIFWPWLVVLVIVIWALLIKVLGNRIHESIVQKISKCIKYILRTLILTVILPDWLTRLLVNSQH